MRGKSHDCKHHNLNVHGKKVLSIVLIVLKSFTQVYGLGLFVDYLNSPLNKTIPPPIPLIHPEYMLRDYGEICRSPYTLTDSPKIGKRYPSGVLWLHIISKYILLLSITLGIK